MTPAPPSSASPLQALPSAVPGVRRSLVADTSGRAVEVVEVSGTRLARLPQGGVFAPFVPDGDRAVLGPLLSRRIAELGLSPVALLAIVERVLVDLDVLHAAGGAHGALDVDGWGLDNTGTFRVRANLGAAQRAGTPHEADVAAVGEALSRLTPRGSLEEAGFTKAIHWLHGAGVGIPRVGFSTARAALQALRALAPRRNLAAEAAAELEAAGLRLPPRVSSFAVRPVAQGQTRAHQLARDQANAEARAWVVRELDRLRQARLQDAALRARQRAERDIDRLAQMARQEHAALVAESAPVRVGILEPPTSPEPVTGARPNLPPVRDELPVVRVATMRRSLTAPRPVLPVKAAEVAPRALPAEAPGAGLTPEIAGSPEVGVGPLVASVPAGPVVAAPVVEAPVVAATVPDNDAAEATPPEGAAPEVAAAEVVVPSVSTEAAPGGDEDEAAPEPRQGEEGGDPDEALLAEAAVVAEARHDAEGEEAEAFMEEAEGAAGAGTPTTHGSPAEGGASPFATANADTHPVGAELGGDAAIGEPGRAGAGELREEREAAEAVELGSAGVEEPGADEGPTGPGARSGPSAAADEAELLPAEPAGDAGTADVEGDAPRPHGHAEGALRHAAEEVEAAVNAAEAGLVAVTEEVEDEAARVFGATPPSHERVVDQVEGLLAGGLVGGVEAAALAAGGGLGAVAAIEAVLVGGAVGVAEQIAQEGVVAAGHAGAAAVHPSAPPVPDPRAAEPAPAPSALDAPDPLAEALARRVEEAAALARKEAEARAEAAERARLDAERKLLEAERAALAAERRALEAERSIPRVLGTPPNLEDLPEIAPGQPADFGDDDPQPTVPGGVPAGSAAPRNLAGVSGAVPTPPAPPPARPPGPEAGRPAPSPEPPFPDLVDADHRDVAGSPRWSGAVGVTGDSRREREKGPGKWVEQGRSAEELQAQLPSNGPRPVDLTESASGSGGAAVWIFVGLVVIIAAVGVAIFW